VLTAKKLNFLIKHFRFLQIKARDLQRNISFSKIKSKSSIPFLKLSKTKRFSNDINLKKKG